MATYTSITNGQVDVNSPIDQALITALRDNPIAISEGATGAPRVKTAALEAPTQGSTNTLVRVVQGGLWSITTSTFPTNPNNAVEIQAADNAIGFSVHVAGGMQIALEQRADGTATTSTVRVYQNGTQIQEWDTTSVSAVSRTLNFDISQNDMIVVAHTNTGGTAAGSSISNFVLKSNTNSFFATLF